MNQSFEVVYTTDDGGWLAQIPTVAGCRSWGRSLTEARRNVREALAAAGDVLGEQATKIAKEAHFADRIELPPDAAEELKARTEAAVRAHDAEGDLRARTVSAAKALLATGMSLRDAGELLGITQEGVRHVLRKDEEADPAQQAKKAEKKAAKATKKAEKKAAKLASKTNEKAAKATKKAEEKAAKAPKKAEEKAAKAAKKAEEKAAKKARKAAPAADDAVTPAKATAEGPEGPPRTAP